jgi:hypothetical protein
MLTHAYCQETGQLVSSYAADKLSNYICPKCKIKVIPIKSQKKESTWRCRKGKPHLENCTHATKIKGKSHAAKVHNKKDDNDNDSSEEKETRQQLNRVGILMQILFKDLLNISNNAYIRRLIDNSVDAYFLPEITSTTITKNDDIGWLYLKYIKTHSFKQDKASAVDNFLSQISNVPLIEDDIYEKLSKVSLLNNHLYVLPGIKRNSEYSAYSASFIDNFEIFVFNYRQCPEWRELTSDYFCQCNKIKKILPKSRILKKILPRKHRLTIGRYTEFFFFYLLCRYAKSINIIDASLDEIIKVLDETDNDFNRCFDEEIVSVYNRIDIDTSRPKTHVFNTSLIVEQFMNTSLLILESENAK